MKLAHSPATHLLLCGPVPNRPRTGPGPRPGGWGPLFYNTIWAVITRAHAYVKIH